MPADLDDKRELGEVVLFALASIFAILVLLGIAWAFA
jgi:hypothetical protein